MAVRKLIASDTIEFEEDGALQTIKAKVKASVLATKAEAADLATGDNPLKGAYGMVANALVRIETVDDLRALPPPTRKTVLYVEGYHVAGDGGGGNFYWSATSNEADNGGTVIVPDTAPTNGRWKRALFGFVDPVMFGAKNDGTDSTEAWTAAANVAGTALAAGRRIQFSGEYTMTTQGQGVSLPEGVEVQAIGYGLLKASTNATNTGIFRLADRVKIRGIIFEGPQGDTVAAYVAGQTALSNSNTGEALVAVEVEGCEMYGWGDLALGMWRPKQCHVRKSWMHNLGRGGAFFYGGEYSDLVDNVIEDIGPGSGGVAPFINAYGFSFTNDVSEAGFPRPTGHKAVQNRIRGVHTWEGMDIHGGLSIALIGNEVTDCAIGAFIGPCTNGSQTNTADDISLIGNKFSTTTTYRRAGILLAPSYNVGTVYGRGFTLSNNEVVGYGTNQATFDNGGAGTNEGAIHIIGAKAVELDGNHVRDFHLFGIRVRQHSQGVNISGGSVTDGTAVSGTVYAVDIENSTTVIAHIDGIALTKTAGTMNGFRLGDAASGAFGVTLGRDIKMSNLDSKFEASFLGRLRSDSPWLLGNVSKGTVSNNGATATLSQGHGVTASRISTGRVTVTFDEAMGTANYQVQVTSQSGSARFASVGNKATASFDVFTWTDAGALADANFTFTVSGF